MRRGCHTASGVGVFVPLGQLEQDNFLFLIVDVVEQMVGSDAKSVLGDELSNDNLACQAVCAFPLRSWIVGQRSDGSGNGGLVIGRDLGERFPKRTRDSFDGKDDCVAQL